MGIGEYFPVNNEPRPRRSRSQHATDDVGIPLSGNRAVARPERESLGLCQIAGCASKDPHAILSGLLAAAVELCGGGPGTSTAGVSLLEAGADGQEHFRWVALAGRLAEHAGGTTPRNFSPCGECLDRNRSIIIRRPDLKYPYFATTGIEFTEGLVIPFVNRIDGAALGTIWVVSHPPARRRFDAEDVTLMETLTRFASAGYSLAAARNAADGTKRTYRDAIAAVGRDMRTSLNTISGCVDLLSLETQGAVTRGQSEYLERIRKSAQLLLVGINALSEAVDSEGGASSAPNVHRSRQGSEA